MCVRAVVPRLHVFSWRQFIVAIVKTKFASHAICFDPDDFNGDGEEIEADIKVMTEQRNHKIWTVNRANANQALSNSTFANVYDGLIQKGLLLQLNINHLERTLGERREASLVFGSVEAACSPEFEQYATSLIERQTLD
ncbi:hypothetical protein B0A54_18031 [Friedmanniomyces endolithicus]|uniref:Uncharacterized protein n=1 Tax=Friedmanniomyces endolithicus TaxID=329885 RepID=A0A4U0TKS9_9PEZI|nr:hypothetical protein B0A54_18031 [Friedmanniomyces endolithicus]